MSDGTLDLTYSETIRLINTYKKQSVLWQHGGVGLRNDVSKDQAWIIIAAETGMTPSACKRKITSLSASCRREKAKIMRSIEEGKQERPTWRYWNSLKFLRGLDDDEVDPLGTAPEMDILDPTLTPAWNYAKRVAKLKKEGPQKVRLINGNEESDGDFSNTFGFEVATKLRKMYRDQRTYAEKLINSALEKGLNAQLTKDDQVRTPTLPGGSKIQKITDPPLWNPMTPKLTNNKSNSTIMVAETRQANTINYISNENQTGDGNLINNERNLMIIDGNLINNYRNQMSCVNQIHNDGNQIIVGNLVNSEGNILNNDKTQIEDRSLIDNERNQIDVRNLINNDRNQIGVRNLINNDRNQFVVRNLINDDRNQVSVGNIIDNGRNQVRVCDVIINSQESVGTTNIIKQAYQNTVTSSDECGDVIISGLNSQQVVSQNNEYNVDSQSYKTCVNNQNSDEIVSEYGCTMDTNSYCLFTE